MDFEQSCSRARRHCCKNSLYDCNAKRKLKQNINSSTTSVKCRLNLGVPSSISYAWREKLRQARIGPASCRMMCIPCQCMMSLADTPLLPNRRVQMTFVHTKDPKDRQSTKHTPRAIRHTLFTKNRESTNKSYTPCGSR